MNVLVPVGMRVGRREAGREGRAKRERKSKGGKIGRKGGREGGKVTANEVPSVEGRKGCTGREEGRKRKERREVR